MKTTTVDVLVDTHLVVPKSFLDMGQIEADLRVYNKSKQRAAELGLHHGETHVDLWSEDERDNVWLPRGYSLKRALLPGVVPRFLRKRHHFPKLRETPFLGEIRGNQQAPSAALMQKAGIDKLLCLGCGKGKTVLAIWYALRRNVKTLIIVDRTYIADQWIEGSDGKGGIKRFAGIPREEVGFIGDGTFRVGERFTVALVQTLYRYDFGPEFYNSFGLIIVDEAHVMAAPKFSTVVPRFPGERLLLTATVQRKDGMEAVFLQHGGGSTPCYTDLSRDRKTVWYFKQLPDIAKPVYQRLPSWAARKRGWTRPGGTFNRAKYETNASESEQWKAIVLEDVLKAVRAGRNVLLLGGRTEFLKDLAARTQALGISASYVTGEVLGEARKEAFTKQVIYATWQIAGKALDLPRLDTIFLTFPNDDAGFLRQAAGRMDRPVEGDNKEALFIVYCHDFIKSLAYKAKRMVSAVRTIDEDADIRFVK